MEEIHGPPHEESSELRSTVAEAVEGGGGESY